MWRLPAHSRSATTLWAICHLSPIQTTAKHHYESYKLSHSKKWENIHSTIKAVICLGFGLCPCSESLNEVKTRFSSPSIQQSMGTCQGRQQGNVLCNSHKQVSHHMRSLITSKQGRGYRFCSTCENQRVWRISIWAWSSTEKMQIGVTERREQGLFWRTAIAFAIRRDDVAQKFINSLGRQDKHLSPWHQTTASSRFLLLSLGHNSWGLQES